jgi:hypothetical protein
MVKSDTAMHHMLAWNQVYLAFLRWKQADKSNASRHIQSTKLVSQLHKIN